MGKDQLVPLILVIDGSASGRAVFNSATGLPQYFGNISFLLDTNCHKRIFIRLVVELMMTGFPRKYATNYI